MASIERVQRLLNLDGLLQSGPTFNFAQLAEVLRPTALRERIQDQIAAM